MKNRLFMALLLCALFVLPNFSYSQSRAVRQLYREYKHQSSEHFGFRLPGWSVKFVGLFMKDKQAKHIMKHIGRVRVLTAELPEGKTVKDSDRHKCAMKSLRRKGYEDLISVNSKGEKVSIMLRQKGQTIRGLFLMVEDGTEIVIVSLKCRLKLDEINSLIKQFNDDRKGDNGKEGPEIPIIQA